MAIGPGITKALQEAADVMGGVGGAARRSFKLNKSTSSLRSFSKAGGIGAEGVRRVAAPAGKKAAQTAAKQAAATTNITAAHKAVASNFNNAGGWNRVAGTAARSALAGAGIGAVGSLAQGEDPWEGASRGAIVGGIGGASVRGARMAVGAGGKTGFMGAARSMDSRYQYSDSVKTLARTQRENTKVKMHVFGKE